MHFARYSVAVIAGALITVSLLFTMQYLIAHGQSALTDTGNFHFLDFVRVEREENVARKKPKPKKPPTPDQPPPDMPPPQQDAVNPGSQVIGVAPISASADLSIGGFGLAVSDGDYLPIGKVEPIYPRRANAPLPPRCTWDDGATATNASAHTATASPGKR